MNKLMRNTAPSLLMGVLSMLLAEVVSGASQVWYLSGWGLLLTWPLYMGHILFFVAIALKKGRTTLPQLYFYGLLFALYESWITKVMWAGYIDKSTIDFVPFMGIGVKEFPVIILFWHPIMSFIAPVLTYQVLSGKAVLAHHTILRKTPLKTAFISAFMVGFGAFVAVGNKFNPVSVTLALVGTMVIVFFLKKLSGDTNILELNASRKRFVGMIAYLVLLYVFSFFLILPERIPHTPLPYISVLFLYLFFILILAISTRTPVVVESIQPGAYQVSDLIRFGVLIVVSAILSCLFQSISYPVLVIVYIACGGLGIVVFVYFLISVLRNTFQINLSQGDRSNIV